MKTYKNTAISISPRASMFYKSTLENTLKALLWLFICVVGLSYAQASVAQDSPTAVLASGNSDDEVSAALETDRRDEYYVALSQLTQAPATLSQPVTLRLRSATLEQVLNRVSEETGLEFVYGKQVASASGRVSVDLESMPAHEALREILRGTGRELMLSSGGQLVLVNQGAATGLPKMKARGADFKVKPTKIQATGKVPLRSKKQQGTITGTVTDSLRGEPIPGVNVVIVGTQQGSATGAEGQYTITGVEPGDYDLRATFIGYAPQTVEGVEVSADDTVTVDFNLRPSTMELEEVVAIGYGTAQRKNLTGSVGSIDATETAEVQTVDNVGQFLQGRVPGLNAGVATEAEGETALEVRGRNSIQAGNNPLLVIDGVPSHQGSLTDINPNDVESIDVLKGASAAAVYGASAAAGVIEVTTKKGTSPEPTIRFKSSVGIATQGDVVRPYGPEEYVQYRRDAERRLNPGRSEHYYADPRNLPSDITLEEWEAMGTGGGEPVEIWLGRIGLSSAEIQNYMDGQPIDWHDEVYRNAALRQNYDFSLSGRLESMSYHWSVGYVDNQGEYVGGRFKTLRTRLNLSADATDWLEVGLRGHYANQDRGYLSANATHAQRVSPYGDMYEDDGTLSWYPHNDGIALNPFLYTSQSGRQYEWRNQNVLATIFGNVDLPLGLEYSIRWTNDYDFRKNYLFNPSTTPFGEPAGNASRQEYSGHVWQVDNILTWNQTVAGIHTFDATFLFNVEVHNEWITDVSNDQFSIETLGYGGLSLGENPAIESNDSRATGNALMGRLNYRLFDRYLFTVSYRRDGYSAFGRSNPYAYFPSTAFAWRISEEPFFGVDPIDDLKLRLSWGVNGNRSIGTYSALQRLGTMKYMYGTETVTGIESSNLPNRNLKWERTTQYNMGLDFGFFSGRLSGAIDVYYMSTSDLLLQRSLPDITGYSNIWSNLGKVVNRGLEMSLSSANVLNEEFSWVTDFTFSMNRNEIKALYGDGEDDRQNDWFIGHALDEIYDYEILGVWQEDEAEEAARYGKEPGDFKLRDVNDDGLLTPIEDKVFQGYTEPRYRLSLVNDVSYKNFSASAVITSHLGHYAVHNVHKHSGVSYGRINQLDLPYWTPDNPTNEWGRLASDGDTPDFNYWEETSFVKLQNVSVAYRIPEHITNRFSATGLRVFFNARNVFALSGYDGDDPETHQHTPRLYTLGLNLAF